MTAQSIFDNTLALLIVPERDAADYKSVAVPMINVVLSELFAVNNTVRIARGKPELSEIPTIASLSDEADIEPYVVYKAMLYGVASRLIADDDLQRAVYFHNLYAAGAADCCRAVNSGIIDVYRGSN